MYLPRRHFLDRLLLSGTVVGDCGLLGNIIFYIPSQTAFQVDVNNLNNNLNIFLLASYVCCNYSAKIVSSYQCINVAWLLLHLEYIYLYWTPNFFILLDKY